MNIQVSIILKQLCIMFPLNTIKNQNIIEIWHPYIRYNDWCPILQLVLIRELIGIQVECRKVTPYAWLVWLSIFLEKFCPFENPSLQNESFILQLQANMMEANIHNYWFYFELMLN